MIRESQVEVNIVGRNLKYYKDLGYDCKYGDSINVRIGDIKENSHIKITAICDKCKKENLISLQKYNKNYNKYNIYTCKKCSHFKVKKTNIEKYGVDYPLQNTHVYNKLVLTNIRKYGVTNVFELTDVKNKIKETNNKKYGVDYPQQNIDILNKSNITNKIKYGCCRPAQNISVQEKCKLTKYNRYGDEFFNNIEKIKSTLLERYNVDNISKIFSHKEKIQEYFTSKMLIKYKFMNKIDYTNSLYYCECLNGHEYNIDIKLFHNRLSHNINTCTICYPENSTSSIKECELFDFVKSNYNGDIVTNDRKILDGLELDIYIPELKLAFEYNGLYWHSNIYKEDDYHLNKMLLCMNKGIQLIHIWEDLWIYEKENIKSTILNLLKDDIQYHDDSIKIETFLLNSKILENYKVLDFIKVNKWNVKGDKRLQFNAKSNLPYICDCGFVKLIKKEYV
jgi:hypothetical protein